MSLPAALGMAVADKPESQEICFVPDNDYRRFLRDRVPDLDEQVGRGNFVTADGAVVGRHEGYPFYTIGQRQGLGLAGGPWYVVEKDHPSNTLWVSHAETLDDHADLLDAPKEAVELLDRHGRHDLAARLAEEVFEEVGHAQWVFVIPKMLRPYFLHHRELLGGLARAAWETVLELMCAAAGDERKTAAPAIWSGVPQSPAGIRR